MYERDIGTQLQQTETMIEMILLEKETTERDLREQLHRLTVEKVESETRR